MSRPRPVVAEPAPAASSRPPCLPTGSTMLDLALGGGWAQGRIINIVGDSSTGKTQLAIEACANFARIHEAGKLHYEDPENAFDNDYATVIGFPDVEVGQGLRTVQDFSSHLQKWLKAQGTGPCLYVLDSLDALSDSDELERDYGAASYGTGKAKGMAEMFRRLVGPLADANCMLIIISQTRDNIGVTFGDKKKRSGGNALQFYCSQVVWLHHRGKIKRKINSLERVVGADIIAQVKKNKIGVNYREAAFSIYYNYGIDDEASMLAWLKDIDAEAYLADVCLGMTLGKAKTELSRARIGMEYEILDDLRSSLIAACAAAWEDLEEKFKPPVRKYRDIP